jgi:hypothetical protein
MIEPTTLPATPEEAPLPVVVPAKAETVAVIVTRASSLHQQVEALTIENDDALETAADLLGAVKAFRKEVDTDLGEPARVAHTLWQMIRERFTKHDDPLKADEGTIKGKVQAYYRKRELEREQQIEAAKTQAAARETDEAARDTEAEALLDAGEFEAAEAVLAEPTPPPASPATTAPKTKGMSVRDNWKAEIFSMEKVYEAAAKGDTVAQGILCDKKVIKAAESVASQSAKGMKAKMAVPGVRAYNDPVVSGGKR